MKCYWCGVDPCVEPREVSGHVSCAVCRELDRLRGICTVIPPEHHGSIVKELRLLSGKLREWQTNRFGGPAADYVEPPQLPEQSLAQSIKPSSSKPPEPSGPPPRHLRVDRESHTNPPESAAAEAPSTRKRKKKNRGHNRVRWQEARGTLVRSRLDPLEQSGSELSVQSDLD